MQRISDPQFPGSIKNPFKKTSPATWDYNCIAWATEKTDVSYWPSPHPDQYIWPDDIPLDDSLQTFIKFFQKFGYEVCENGEFEERYMKIAIFVKNNETKHAARQLSDGSWTSKLGPNYDVKHSLKAMEGGVYGDVEQFMRKRVSKFQRMFLGK